MAVLSSAKYTITYTACLRSLSRGADCSFRIIVKEVFVYSCVLRLGSFKIAVERF